MVSGLPKVRVARGAGAVSGAVPPFLVKGGRVPFGLGAGSVLASGVSLFGSGIVGLW